MASTALPASFVAAPATADSPVDPLDMRPVIDVRRIIGVVWRHRYLVAAIVSGCALLALIASLLMTPLYTASGTLQIDQEEQRILDSQESAPVANPQETQRFLKTIVEVLQSRRMAERVANEMGLFRGDAFLDRMGVRAPDKGEPNHVRAHKELVLKTLRDNLGVSLGQETRIVAVGFTSPDPEFSAKLVNTFIASFLRYNIERRLDKSTYARDFLSQQLDEARQRLERAERSANEYARTSGLIRLPSGDGPESGSTTITTVDLGRFNEGLTQARTARIAAQSRWDQVSGAPDLAIPELVGNKAMQDLLTARTQVAASLEQELATKQRSHPAVVPLVRQLAKYDQQIASLSTGVRRSIRNEYQGAVERENALATRVSALAAQTQSERDRGVQLNTLTREVETSRSLYDSLLQRFREMSAEANITANNVQQIDIAEAPTRPSSPRLLLNIALGLLAGMGLATLAVIFREQMDDHIKSPDDVERKLGVKLLGITPQVTDGTAKEALLDSKSAMSEAMYSLRTAIQFANPAGPPRRLLVTSSQKEEGKSTTAFGLARAFAEVGRPTLIIDCDLRRPSLHRQLGIANDHGLIDVLTGALSFEKAVSVTDTAGLMALRCGSIPANPTDILASDRFAQLLAQLADQYELIVLDAPPVLGLADAIILSSLPDVMTLMLVDSASSYRGRVRGALRRLMQGKANVIGAVLSRFDFASAKRLGVSDSYVMDGGYSYYEYGN